MKYCLITLLSSLLFLTGYSQDPNFYVHGKYSRPVTKETLNDSKLLRDFIPGYPVNWISNYISVEIIATSSGKEEKSVGINETLTAEQKNILKNVDLSSDITINIKHKYKNPVTYIKEDNVVTILITVIPEVEAEFIGGREQLNFYIKEKVSNNNFVVSLPDWLKAPQQYKEGKVSFAINERGEIVDVKISKSYGDSKTDQLLYDAIKKMPRWKPAETAKGIKVRQEFILSYGSGGC